MPAARLLLLHSPLTGSAVWARLAPELGRRGRAVLVPEVVEDDRPPYGARYVASVIRQLRLGPAGPPNDDPPVILVAHSGAGPLVGMLGAALRAARIGVHGYVLVDAGLPRPGGASRLDLWEAEDREGAAAVRAELAAGVRFPVWTSDDLAEEIPDLDDRVAVLAGVRPRGLDYFDEALACPGDWPDAPGAYLRTSPAYDAALRLARARDWVTDSVNAGHFAMLSQPTAVAGRLLALLD